VAFQDSVDCPEEAKGLDRATRSYKRKALKLKFRDSALKVTLLSKNSALQRSERLIHASTSSTNQHDAHNRS
jgi:hypothetical protein